MDSTTKSTEQDVQQTLTAVKLLCSSLLAEFTVAFDKYLIETIKSVAESLMHSSSAQNGGGWEVGGSLFSPWVTGGSMPSPVDCVKEAVMLCFSGELVFITSALLCHHQTDPVCQYTEICLQWDFFLRAEEV